MNDTSLCLEAILSNEYIDVIMPYAVSPEELANRYNAACYQVINKDYVVLHIKKEFEDLCVLEGKDLKVNIMNDVEILAFTGKKNLETELRYLPTFEELNLTGKGVIIGIANSGIDYTLPIFINEDKESKILSIWDQTIQGNPPDGFLYGTEYTKEDINQAINSDNPKDIVPHIDETGSGTYLAGITAGYDNTLKDFVGVAKDSELVIVKLKQSKEIMRRWQFLFQPTVPTYQDSDIMLGINYIIKKARQYNKPVVILVTLSSNIGVHNGSTIIERYLDDIADIIGNVVVVSAGNEGNKRSHYQNKISKDNYQDVQINIGDNQKGLYISMIARTPDILSIAFISPTGNSYSRVSPRFFVEEEANFYLENTRICINHVLISTRFAFQIYTLRVYKPTLGVWIIRVFGDVIIYGIYDIWIQIEQYIQKDTYFLDASNNITLTIPATSSKAITVGAYDSKNGSIYNASSRGYTSDNFVKPNIVAPGVNIYGPFPNNEYGTMTGTEVSAGIVAGISALLLEWGIVKEKYKQMNTAIVNNYLIKGARRRATFKYPNNTWGYGEVDLYNTFNILSIQ